MPDRDKRTRDTLEVYSVKIQRNESSQPIEHKDAVNCFTKGIMYCVMTKDSDKKYHVYKYPVNSIFRVIEDY